VMTQLMVLSGISPIQMASAQMMSYHGTNSWGQVVIKIAPQKWVNLTVFISGDAVCGSPPRVARHQDATVLKVVKCPVHGRAERFLSAPVSALEAPRGAVDKCKRCGSMKSLRTGSSVTQIPGVEQYRCLDE
jgi:hypothetical protein